MEYKMEKVNLNLSINQLNLILAALGKVPYETVYGLVEEINKQVIPQIQKLSNETQDNKE
jgi:hypothetical protein